DAAIADYLNNWGYRCSGELMLTEKNYRDDPAMFIDLLKQYDQLSDVNPEKIISEKGLEQRKIIRGFKQKIWKKYGLFFPLALVHIVLLKLLVRFTMRGIASRERVRLKQALLYFKFKQILQKTGTLLHKDVGVLENPDDVLYLRYQEIAESLTASEMLSANLKNRILSRKQQYDNSSKHSYPDDFFTTLGEYTPPEKVKAKSTPLASSALEGLSACGGFVKGRARVLESVSEAWKIEKGDILITRQTDPGWVVLFPLISGLVVERGGMLSHGAIVSREFGVPAIVGVDKAMERIKDKAVIELNADTGQIVICD
ncbi:MAG: PEP-utilizing enzyme, partial [Cyclobacteriaceae bacterium]|nr:PEP-utilizing enzyme [Cyclobacteriaceae bacterium]